MKKYNMNEIVEMISTAEIAIPIEKFTENGSAITKKRYGLILLEHLCEELREKYPEEEPEPKLTKDQYGRQLARLLVVVFDRGVVECPRCHVYIRYDHTGGKAINSKCTSCDLEVLEKDVEPGGKYYERD